MVKFPPVKGERCELWVHTPNGYVRLIAESYAEAQYLQKNMRN